MNIYLNSSNKLYTIQAVLYEKKNDFGKIVSVNTAYSKNPQKLLPVNAHSEPFLVTSGVRQGSNLGPLLFTIFIIDLPVIFQTSKCLLYADDCKIYTEIRFVENAVELIN